MRAARRWLVHPALAVAFGLAAGTARAAPIEIAVRRAYHAWIPPMAERVTGLRLVAVELSVRDQLGGTFGARTLTVAGRTAALAIHLTGAGEPADPRDPALVDQERFGLLLLVVLPRALDRVQVRHRADAVGEAAVETAGPRIPVASHRVSAHAAAGAAPLAGFQRHRVVVEARDWSRVAEPGGFRLLYQLAGEERTADVDRWIEVDQEMRPLGREPRQRPLVVPLRRFVLEFWLVDGGRPLALIGGGQQALPAATLALPAAAEAALARAAPNLDAAHYQAE